MGNYIHGVKYHEVKIRYGSKVRCESIPLHIRAEHIYAPSGSCLYPSWARCHIYIIQGFYIIVVMVVYSVV